MDNQRRSFRLDVEVGFEALLLSEEKFNTGIVELKRRPAWGTVLPSALSDIDAALASVLNELKGTAPKAARAMELLNQKLDLLRLGQHWSGSQRELPLRRVNLSATGLAFEYRKPVDLGSGMRCTLSLPSTCWTLQFFARVVSVRPLGEGRYKICLDFAYIRDEDVDQLIRFNLQEQQRLLAAENG